jgi:uncharacterized protein (DUF2249 family)
MSTRKKKNLIKGNIFLGGKHKGETIESVYDHDPQYLYYLRDSAQMSDEDYIIIAEYLENKA